MVSSILFNLFVIFVKSLICGCVYNISSMKRNYLVYLGLIRLMRSNQEIQGKDSQRHYKERNPWVSWIFVKEKLQLHRKKKQCFFA